MTDYKLHVKKVGMAISKAEQARSKLAPSAFPTF